MEIELFERVTPGSIVTRSPNGWKLEIPAGAKGKYRMAQLDDYAHLARNAFLWQPPLTVQLRARVSASDLPGTWGFGLWNDPFGLGLGFGGTPRRLPTFPETGWFFHASPPNSLALDDKLPANGFFAGSFHSTLHGGLALAGLPLLPLLAIRPISRRVRHYANLLIQEAAVPISVDVTNWHEYCLQWLREWCLFKVDGLTLLESRCTPSAPLGLVLWIDNQYAGWSSRGEIRYGTLNNAEAWLEVEDLQIGKDDLEVSPPRHAPPLR